MIEKPHVSIILPTYNSESTILECVKSVLNQSYNRWELLILDDASVDRTLSILDSLESGNEKVRVIRSEVNQGVGRIRARGAELARYKYVAFIDSDDLWVFNKLEEHMKFIATNNLKFSFTAYYTFREGLNRKWFISAPNRISYKDLLRTCSITTSTVIVEKELLLGNMSFWRTRQDYITWLNVLKHDIVAYGLDLPLTELRLGHKSLSSNKLKVARIQFLVYRVALGLSFLRSVRYFMDYMLIGMVKYLKRRI